MELSNVIDNHNRSKEIIEKLLSKKISRDMPSKLFKIEQIIGEKIQRNQYIELLGLWGGSKEGIPGDEADKKSLDSLVYIRNKSRDIRISLLFCDFHHHYANNVSWEETIKYFEVSIFFLPLPLDLRELLDIPRFLINRPILWLL